MNKVGFTTTATALLAAGILAAGCGSSSNSTSAPATPASTTPASTASTSTSSSSSSSSSGAAQVVKLAANPSGELKYDTTHLTAKPGKVTIEFTNSSPLSHNVTVASAAGATLGATPTFTGGAKSVTLDLKAGTYSFFCTVPGHRQAGMQGTLTVG